MNKKKRKVRNASGQLVEVDDTELQQLSGQSGLDAPPTSPGAAQGIGASPDQAKMAGTKQQKETALDIAQQAAPTDTLQGAQRTQQARTQPTAFEQDKQQRSEDLTAKFGTLGTSVANLINNKMSSLENISESTMKVNPDLDISPDAAKALEAFAAAPTDRQAQVTAAQKLGLNAADVDIAEKLGKYLQQDNAAEILATKTPDKILASEVMSELGTDAEEIQELLEIDDVALGELTLQELQDQLEVSIQAEFDQVSDLEAVANDPTASPSERSEARKQLKDMGATGVYVQEAQMQDLTKQIDQGDVIQLGEEEVSVEEMLSDENISSVIEQYVSGDEETRGEIQEAYGTDFASWIETNEGILEDAATDLDTSLQELATEAEARQALTKNLGSDIIEAIFPGWDEFEGDISDAPAIIQMSLDGSLDPADLGVIKQELAGLSSEELANAEWLKDEEQVTQFLGWHRLAKGQGSKEDLFSLILGDDVSSYELERDFALNKAIGLKPTHKYRDILDSNRDGKLDDHTTIFEKLQAQNLTPQDLDPGKWKPSEGTLDLKLRSFEDFADNIHVHGEYVPTLLSKLNAEDKKKVYKGFEDYTDRRKKHRSHPSSWTWGAYEAEVELLKDLPEDSKAYKETKKWLVDFRKQVADAEWERKKPKKKPKKKKKRKKKKKSGVDKVIEAGVRGVSSLLGG